MGCRFEPYLWSHLSCRWRTTTGSKRQASKPQKRATVCNKVCSRRRPDAEYLMEHAHFLTDQFSPAGWRCRVQTKGSAFGKSGRKSFMPANRLLPRTASDRRSFNGSVPCAGKIVLGFKSDVPVSYAARNRDTYVSLKSANTFGRVSGGITVSFSYSAARSINLLCASRRTGAKLLNLA